MALLSRTPGGSFRVLPAPWCAPGGCSGTEGVAGRAGTIVVPAFAAVATAPAAAAWSPSQPTQDEDEKQGEGEPDDGHEQDPGTRAVPVGECRRERLDGG